MMPAGTWWIGDLCYVMHDEWDEVCELTTKGHDCLSGEFVLSNGVRFALYSTAYGDGVYLDQYGNEYGVDAGLIGCILVSDIQKSDQNNIKLGHVHEFGVPFATSYDNSVINIGNIRIDTDPEYVEEENYEYD